MPANEESNFGQPVGREMEDLLRGFHNAVQVGVVVRNLEKSMAQLTSLFAIGPFRVIEYPPPGLEISNSSMAVLHDSATERHLRISGQSSWS